MIRVGITGQSGFIGGTLYRLLRITEHIECVDFHRDYFASPEALAGFVRRCDSIVHLAAVSRHPDGERLFQTNLQLTERLLAAARATGFRGAIYLGSTTHEAKEQPYHASKRASRARLEAWAAETGGRCTTLLMANTFGPGSRPFYNSVVSTFCRQCARRQPCTVTGDSLLELIYVDDLVRAIRDLLLTPPDSPAVTIAATDRLTVSALAAKLQAFAAAADKPVLHGRFDAALFNTFVSYR